MARQVCPLELAGNCTVTCPATGLTLTLKFRDEHSVKGSIVKRGSEARIAIFSGRWDGAVNVEVPDLGAGGTVSNARALAPAVVPWVNLAQPGPRRLTRLWSAILQSMYFMDVHQVESRSWGKCSVAETEEGPKLCMQGVAGQQRTHRTAFKYPNTAATTFRHPEGGGIREAGRGAGDRHCAAAQRILAV